MTILKDICEMAGGQYYEKDENGDVLEVCRIRDAFYDYYDRMYLTDKAVDALSKLFKDNFIDAEFNSFGNAIILNPSEGRISLRPSNARHLLIEHSRRDESYYITPLYKNYRELPCYLWFTDKGIYVGSNCDIDSLFISNRISNVPSELK